MKLYVIIHLIGQMINKLIIVLQITVNQKIIHQEIKLNNNKIIKMVEQ